MDIADRRLYVKEQQTRYGIREQHNERGLPEEGQVNEIRKKHQEERKAIREAKGKGEGVEERKLSTEEILSGFYRDDRLSPVITLVIYYGEEEWTTPKRFRRETQLLLLGL